MSKHISGLKSIFISLIEYVIAVLIVLDCNTPYSRSITTDFHLPEIIAVFTFALFLLILDKLRIKRKTIIVIGSYFSAYFIAMLLLFFLSVDKNSPFAFLARFLVMVPLLTIIQTAYQIRGNHYRLLLKYSNVVFALSVMSLAFWVLGSNMHVINPTNYLNANWGRDYSYPSYFGLYFERQIDSFLFYKGFRNIGIFCEAPMFSVNLVIAIAIKVFLQPYRIIDKNRKGYKSNIVKIIIMMVALITTLTTTGYIAIIFIVIAKYIIGKPKNARIKVIKYLTGMLVALIGSRVAYGIYINKAESVSWMVRLDDFSAGIKAWRRSPIWGNGYGDETVLKSFMSSFRSWNMGYSNSIFTVLAQGGILLFSAYLIPIIWGIVTAIKKKAYHILCFEGIMILEFIVTIFPYTFIMLLLISFIVSYCMTVGSGDHKGVTFGTYRLT